MGRVWEDAAKRLQRLIEDWRGDDWSSAVEGTWWGGGMNMMNDGRFFLMRFEGVERAGKRNQRSSASTGPSLLRLDRQTTLDTTRQRQTVIAIAVTLTMSVGDDDSYKHLLVPQDDSFAGGAGI